MQDKGILPHIDKALTFWDELSMEEDSKLRMDIEYSKIDFWFRNRTRESSLQVLKDIQELINRLTKFKNEYKNKILMKLYNLLLNFYDSDEDLEEKINICDKYIDLINKPYDDFNLTLIVYKKKANAYNKIKSNFSFKVDDDLL